MLLLQYAILASYVTIIQQHLKHNHCYWALHLRITYQDWVIIKQIRIIQPSQYQLTSLPRTCCNIITAKMTSFPAKLTDWLCSDHSPTQDVLLPVDTTRGKLGFIQPLFILSIFEVFWNITWTECYSVLKYIILVWTLGTTLY